MIFVKTLLKESDVRRAIVRITHEILEKNKGMKDLCLIGIKRRGDYIARRIAHLIKEIEGKKVPLGALDINLYRDDLQLVAEAPVIEATDITFDVSNLVVILVDDVLYTGRTIRAAIEEILDFGRPRAIKLAVLMDRGHRELPIQADYCGKKVFTADDEIVDVRLKEIDGEDSVVLRNKSETQAPKNKKNKARIRIAKAPDVAVKQLTIADKDGQ